MNLRPPPSLDLARPGSLTRVLLDGMTEGVSLAGEDGLIVFTNPAEDRMFGYAPGELVGRHVAVQTAYPPEDSRRRVALVLEELGRSGQWQGEWRNRRKDGSDFTSRTRISAVEIEGRRHWLCVREDVTEEAQAARVLAEERTRLDLATQAARIGIWDWNHVARTIACSARLRDILGLRADETVTRERLIEIVHPEDRAEMMAWSLRALDPAVRSREPLEYRTVRPDGEVRWILASGEATFEAGPEGPRAVRFLGAAQDITDRRAVEEAERAAARRLRLALEAGRMAVWDLDLVTDTVTGTPELNRLLGFPEDEPLDHDAIRARYAPGELERLRADGRAALERGETSLENEFLYIRPDLGPRWIHLRCDLLFDSEGRPVKAIGVISDETARHRAAEDLKASEARLQLASAAAGAGIWDWNVATGEVVWSPEEFALFGIDPSTPPDRLNEAWLAVLHPEDRDAVVQRTRAALTDGGAFTQDYRVVLADGAVR